MLLERKKRHRQHNEGSWAVSYVDMLTLLLCFFIIFFNQKTITGDDDNSVLKKVMMSMNQNSPAPAGSESGGANGTANQKQNADVKETSNMLEQLKIAFDKKIPAKINANAKSLEIEYDDVSFFDSGSTKITKEGLESIDKMIQVLYPFHTALKITVQGHTDPSKVRGKHNQFTDNWELSVLRATSVLKIFLKSGFEQQSLSAEGFADTLVREPSAENLSKYRNITLRIEPKVNP
ncbi:MAG: flagellar motor protein MotB [Bdellovibrionales bacterium]|nr:flagellar motor protein MotB [Bdellovibrionales bacterium]